ncbi:hypothetical protein FA95DRAFT_1604662 [Auriscalpium vulgare]|uniref:Uncharacterized protein n=1 Tax=Auriscalpium vulgare TaxID=40419 RepID=A0ACB8RZ65_9AGAM|nr:hypothetical protein FA95DRAFT_1604662 [Auriscalpium vulgare]
MFSLHKLSAIIVLGSALVLPACAQDFPVVTLTPAQQTQAQISLVQVAQSSTAQDHLASDVAAAAAVAAGIANNFTAIGTRLQIIDNDNLQPQKFFPAWQDFRNRYLTLLQSAKNQASAIAGYADEFNEGILVIVDDDDIATSSKIAAINNFINKSATFQNSSDSLATGFTQLASDITEFTGNFVDFAKDRDAQDTAEINDLLNQIGSLNAEIARLQADIGVLAIAMGVELLGAGALLATLPQFAPFIIITTLITEGFLAVTEITLSTVMDGDKRKVQGLQGQVDADRTDIALINAVQGQLNATTTNDIPVLTAHLGMFTQVWQDVANDCTKLIGWLQDGADDADMPDIMAVWLDQATTIYDSMSTALTLYATTVTIPSS